MIPIRYEPLSYLFTHVKSISTSAIILNIIQVDEKAIEYSFIIVFFTEGRFLHNF